MTFYILTIPNTRTLASICRTYLHNQQLKVTFSHKICWWNLKGSNYNLIHIRLSNVNFKKILDQFTNLLVCKWVDKMYTSIFQMTSDYICKAQH